MASAFKSASISWHTNCNDKMKLRLLHRSNILIMHYSIKYPRISCSIKKCKLRLLVYLLFAAVVFPQLQAAPEKGSIVKEYKVVVTGLRNDKGSLIVALYYGPDGFPENADKVFRRQTVGAENESITLWFKDLPEGEYAFAILHDENNNKIMDKNFIGIPKEGFAFSNDYKPNSTKVVYDKAKIIISDSKTSATVKMNYYL